jgi:hypothetical protein
VESRPKAAGKRERSLRGVVRTAAGRVPVRSGRKGRGAGGVHRGFQGGVAIVRAPAVTQPLPGAAGVVVLRQRVTAGTKNQIFHDADLLCRDIRTVSERVPGAGSWERHATESPWGRPGGRRTIPRLSVYPPRSGRNAERALLSGHRFARARQPCRSTGRPARSAARRPECEPGHSRERPPRRRRSGPAPSPRWPGARPASSRRYPG